MARFGLRYAPGTHYGEKYPSWRWGFRATRDACEELRERCFNVEQIEVCEVET